MPDVYARTLRRAAQIAGGVKELSAKLGVPSEELALWVQGTKRVPLPVFLRAVDIVVAYDVNEVSNSDPDVKLPAIRKPEN